MYNGMKITVIGYKNHALRLKSCLNKQGIQNVVNFNYHKDNFTDISDSDAFFIASPASNHFEWINKLTPLGKYIFCEKPPVIDKKDLDTLVEYRPKLFFNFNYRFSYLVKLIKKYHNSKELGEIINVHCVSSHGLAFKSSFENDWRFKDKNFFSSIVGNVGIHYVDLMLYLLGSIKSVNMDHLFITSKNLPDTCKLNLVFKKTFVDIFLSYSTVLQNKIDIFYENGILTLSNGLISLISPRDTFDDKGYFKTPETQFLKRFINSRDYYTDSINESIKYFLSCVKSKSNLSLKHYNQSIISNKIMLGLMEKSI